MAGTTSLSVAETCAPNLESQMRMGLAEAVMVTADLAGTLMDAITRHVETTGSDETRLPSERAFRERAQPLAARSDLDPPVVGRPRAFSSADRLSGDQTVAGIRTTRSGGMTTSAVVP